MELKQRRRRGLAIVMIILGVLMMLGQLGGRGDEAWHEDRKWERGWEHEMEREIEAGMRDFEVDMREFEADMRGFEAERMEIEREINDEINAAINEQVREAQRGSESWAPRAPHAPEVPMWMEHNDDDVPAIVAIVIMGMAFMTALLLGAGVLFFFLLRRRNTMRMQ